MEKQLEVVAQVKLRARKIKEGRQRRETEEANSKLQEKQANSKMTKKKQCFNKLIEHGMKSWAIRKRIPMF